MRVFDCDMSFLSIVESCGEGLLRIGIGVGLAWIGMVEGAGYGAFLQVVGVIFVAAGVVEICEVGPRRRWIVRRPRLISHTADTTRAK